MIILQRTGDGRALRMKDRGAARRRIDRHASPIRGKMVRIGLRQSANGEKPGGRWIKIRGTVGLKMKDPRVIVQPCISGIRHRGLRVGGDRRRMRFGRVDNNR